MKISLDKVKKAYPNCKVIEVSEYFIPESGWVDVVVCEGFLGLEDFKRIAISEEEVINKIEKLVEVGCTHVNFILFDEEIEVAHYPDFSIKELSI